MEDKERRQYAVFHAKRNLRYRRAEIFLVMEPEKLQIGDRMFGGVIVCIDKTESWICVAYK